MRRLLLLLGMLVVGAGPLGAQTTLTQPPSGQPRIAVPLEPPLAPARPAAAPESPLIAHLSQQSAEISTTFAGSSIFVFGSSAVPLGLDGADVVVVVRGPTDAVTVRRKVRILGMWFNGPSSRFENVPGFYGVAGTMPAWHVLPEELRRQYGIGLDALEFQRSGASSGNFRQALEDLRREQQLWLEDSAPVRVEAGRLFYVRLPLPATVPAGDYAVEVMLVRNRQVIAHQELPFVVERVGTAATIADVSREQPLLYGVLCVLLAGFAGWLGSVLFRRG